MEIFVANVLFWAAWYLISIIPFVLTQTVIDNYELVKEWKRLLS